MYKKSRVLCVVAGMVFLASLGAYALPTFSGNAVGQWVNVVSTDSTDIFFTANNDIGGNAVFSWGLDDPNRSSSPSVFTFDGVGSDGLPDWTAISGSPFVLGSFLYSNGSGYNNNGVNGVTLSVLLNILSPLGVSDAYDFAFAITNTPNNTGDPVLDGDIVSETNAFSPTQFTYLGVDYTLELLGFSSDGGATIRHDFSSPEGGTASADLYGRLTSDIPNGSIPEPASMLLLGLGLGGIVLRRFRKA